MYASLKSRERGVLSSLEFNRAQCTRRAYNLQLSRTKEIARVHQGGVTSIKIESNEQRYLMSGGVDGRVHIYDLAMARKDSRKVKLRPIASVSRKDSHRYAISTLAWFPFDTGMFITSSYDMTIRVWDTNSMVSASEFTMDSRVNAQAISPIATHCLVAAAAGEPHIRLCDLNTSAFTHTLTGHKGSVLSVVWSPSSDYTLYSGGTDGTIRVWDIRQASACLMTLDRENRGNDPGDPTRIAHGRGVNGLTLTSNGDFLVSFGLDEKIHLWKTTDGSNTFVNYGSLWHNRFPAFRGSAVSGDDVWPPLLYVPSDNRETLVYRLFDGRIVNRLHGAFGRVTSVEARSSFQEVYCASNDCEVLVWEPATTLTIPQNQEADLDAWSESEDEL